MFLNCRSNAFVIYSLFVELQNLQPLVIGIWCGEGKPEASSFLNMFVSELNMLFKDGISTNTHEVFVKVRCFICDTPARAMIKCIEIEIVFIGF